MDNELYTLTNNKQICETCNNWKQFNAMQGLCDDTYNHHTETVYNDTCEHWKQKT